MPNLRPGPRTLRRALPLLLSALLAACVGEPGTRSDEAYDDTGLVGPFDAVPEEGKADGVEQLGPTVATGAATVVWAARNQWADVDTAEARQAGIAWNANSGLDWEQK